MIINRISPQGFCGGVINAIKKATSLNTNNVFCLGPLIHNKIMINLLLEKGVQTINKPGATRLELLDLVPNNSTIIISAHGASPLVFLKARDKKLNIIDATCPFVYKTHEEINKYLNMGYDIYYIGTKGHAEAEGAIGISNKIKLISDLNDIDSIDFKDNSFIINQTTMSIYDIEDFHKKILQKNKNVIISNTICNATTLRQKAVIDAPICDLFIIVGDTLSSNTKKLYNIASKKQKSIMINSKDDLINFDFKNISKVNITSGASTPEFVVDEIIEYLEKKPE